MKKKIIAAFTALCLGATMFAGCGASEEGTAKNETVQSEGNADGAAQDESTGDASQEGSADLSGTLTLAGSTSMEKLCEAMSESFMQANPGVTVTVEYTGSGAGLESLAAGSVDIGNASRGLKDEEVAGGSVENVVAIDGIAVITDKENTVTDITSEDLAKVYTGEVTNWSEIGGSDQPIVAIGREAGSGTRDAFEELLEVKDACKYAQELDSTGAVLAKVAATDRKSTRLNSSH